MEKTAFNGSANIMINNKSDVHFPIVPFNLAERLLCLFLLLTCVVKHENRSRRVVGEANKENASDAS